MSGRLVHEVVAVLDGCRAPVYVLPGNHVHQGRFSAPLAGFDDRACRAPNRCNQWHVAFDGLRRTAGHDAQDAAYTPSPSGAKALPEQLERHEVVRVDAGAVRPRARLPAHHGGPAAGRRGPSQGAAPFLGDFVQPRLETNVGVAKPGAPGVRYVDVLVIEEGPRSGAPRVETFSFESRDFRLLEAEYLTAQMIADASEALRYYGEKLNIRRPTLHLRGSQVQVHRVRLIYEGGILKPGKPAVLKDALNEAQGTVKGVEVLFE